MCWCLNRNSNLLFKSTDAYDSEFYILSLHAQSLSISRPNASPASDCYSIYNYMSFYNLVAYAAAYTQIESGGLE